ncbi:MAG: class I tRNA ligase family protein [Bdellovibrionales bacterium]|nr:class I tRNA ligase family protein [Bdellovibrionales bacterium]
MDKRDSAAFKPADIPTLLKQVRRPRRAVVTAGMPYANGTVHIGHLAGAHIPADIYARWLRMLIGAENVLFVCGTDDHGSTSELSALRANKPIREFIDEIHVEQEKILEAYGISLDIYSGTSRPETFPAHKALSQDFIRKLHKNGLLEKKASQQWFDPKLNRFLQDRFVTGKCPNPKCDNEAAYSDECDRCGAQYLPTELQNPKSAMSDATPILKETVHWWLDMWKVSEQLRTWIQSKEKVWRKPVYTSVVNTVLPALVFDNTHEAVFKELRSTLPKHSSRYAPGKKVVVQFENKPDLSTGQGILAKAGIPTTLMDEWAHRSISRDVAWGIPMPEDLDPDMKGKTLYVWPDSLIAPIAFTQAALKKQGRDPNLYRDFWMDPEASIYQFLGQDNVYFYVLMQGGLWLGSQTDPYHLPHKGEFQLTENVFGAYHLLVDGHKISKSRGNAEPGIKLLKEHGYSADQMRYFVALLSLPEKQSNLDFATLVERNKFLAGPLNAAFEKPISACHSKFGGVVPAGTLIPKVQEETTKIVQRYLRSMERGEYSTLLFAVENYARQINSLFTQFKPHDDRAPEKERADALYSCFYVLKNLMIMLAPFAPETMHRLRKTLNLPEETFKVDELGVPLPAGHKIGAQQEYFPSVAAE